MIIVVAGRETHGDGMSYRDGRGVGGIFPERVGYVDYGECRLCSVYSTCMNGVRSSS